MTIPNITFTSKDQQLIDKVSELLPEGYYVKKYSDLTYVIARKDRSVPAFNKYMRDLGLYGKKTDIKFIPKNYLFNTIENKTWLLKGLMDTDGYSDKRHIEFSTCSKQLNQDFLDLARSLGISCKSIIKKTSYKKNGIKIDCLNSHRISLYTNSQIFHLDRKQNNLEHIKSKAGQSKYDKTFITNVEYIGKSDGYCIGVDNETKTYIADNYIVTHNSFTTAGIMGQVLTFDGLKYFTTETFNNPPKVSVCVGAAISDNSSELCSKLVDGLNCYGTEKSLGVWGSYEDDDYTPNPFYRDWVGSVNSGNKKNPFRYSYKVQTKAGWITKGTGTSLLHVNYSDKKQGGAQAAAGGRYLFSVMEEIGLQANFVDSLLSNTATVSDKGGQFGVQWAIGTSGNIDLVQQSKKAFTNPGEYNFLEFDDIWEGSGKIGLFLPAYLTDVSYKDDNGNTKLEDVLEHYAKRREEANNANDPEVLRNEKMNYPLVPSDMWITSKGHYFPIMECLDREKELLKNRLYETIGTPKKLIWDSKALNGVKSEYDPDAEPFYDFPYDRSMSTIDGAIMIYEEPNIVKGEVPDDMYIFSLDPYVAENVEDGGSLGALMGFLNPKYTKDGFNGNYLICSYIGKHSEGKDAYYENVEKILAYYGNPPRGLWYEANRGEAVRGYFMRKKKMHLLAIRPNKEKGSSAVDRRVLEYGYVVGNKVALLDMIGNTYEWLLSKTVHDGVEKRVIETFPCIFTIRQMINFHFDKHSNFDAVSSVLGYPLALKEIEHQIVEETAKKGKHNPLTFLSMNPYLFKTGREMVNRHERMKQLLN